MSKLHLYVFVFCSAFESFQCKTMPTRQERPHASECLEDTWGNADASTSVPYTASDLKCEFSYTDFVDAVDKPVTIYYPDTDTFNNFHGTDLVPEKHDEFPDGTSSGYHLRKTRVEKWEKGKNGPPAQEAKIQLGECNIPQADGGGWMIQRLGPFNSTGGYDWWQVGWRDAFRLSRLFEDHPQGVKFTANFAAGVEDKTGEILGYPPIHMHHLHILPAPGVKHKMTPGMARKNLMGGSNELNSYKHNWMVERHGDYECTQKEGGSNCLFETTPEGYARNIDKVIDVEADFNDIRPAGSKPLTWWLQIGLRWHPKSLPKKTASFASVLGPGKRNTTEQLTEVKTFMAPTNESILYWYSGQMASDGKLLRNKIHTHASMFNKAFWFRASPEELGLVGNAAHDFGMKRKVWLGAHLGDENYDITPKLLRDTSFHNFDELTSYLLGNLDAAAKRQRLPCLSKFLGDAQRCAEQEPFLVCEGVNDIEEYVEESNGVRYAVDRRVKTCCRPWDFKTNDIYTVVGFMEPMKLPPGPQSQTLPTVYPMHVSWFLTYEGPESKDDASFLSAYLSLQPNADFLVFGDPCMPGKQNFQCMSARPPWPDDILQLSKERGYPNPYKDSKTKLPSVQLHRPEEADDVVSLASMSFISSSIELSSSQIRGHTWELGALASLMVMLVGGVLVHCKRSRARCEALWCSLPPPCFPKMKFKSVQHQK